MDPHAIPGGDIVDSAFATTSLVSLFTLLAAASALVGTQHSGFAIFTAVVSVLGAWAVSTSAAFDMRIEVVSGGHWLTLLTTALIVAVLGKLLRVRAGFGIALLAAGLASLVLNGAHETYGGIGDAQANIGIALATLGWAWVAVSLAFESWGRAQAGHIRRRVAAWFQSAAQRLAPDNIA